MRSSILLIILLTTQFQIVFAFDIKPRFSKNENVFYNIQTIDEYPSKKNKKYIIHKAYNASIHLKEQSEDKHILEWKYLPTDNLILQCFATNDICYSWTDDVKQKLTFLFSLNDNGSFNNLDDPENISNQIGVIFDGFTKNHPHYSQWEEPTLKKLKESVIHDFTILSEFSELHAIYGNSVNNGKFTDDSIIIQNAKTIYDEYSHDIEVEEDLLTITMVLFKTHDFDPIRKSSHKYNWKISMNDMIVSEMIKDVEISAEGGIKKYKLNVRRTTAAGIGIPSHAK